MWGTGFEIAALSARGRQDFVPLPINGLAAWYDPSDLSTLWQDEACTVPVTASGQTVALMLDKSGNDRHFLRATEAARPSYQASGGLHWLQCDGVDDGMATAAFGWGGDEVTAITGVRKLSDAAPGVVFEFAEGGVGANGRFGLLAPSTTLTNRVAFISRGTASASAVATASAFAAPATLAIACLGKISSDTSLLRINGVQVAQSTGDQGAGTFGTYPLYLGSRGGNAFNGHFYGMALYSRVLAPAELEQAEAWMTAKAGVGR